MSKYYCNPLNLAYRYQYNSKEKKYSRNREAADPSLIEFKGNYYLFPSMNRAFWKSADLVNWEIHELKNVPVYDYAPDVRVLGKYMYFCASRSGRICDFYRTEDPESGRFERIEGTFEFWDPNLFVDEDGRVYFYWGCSNVTPIWGVELDPETMKPIGEKVVLIENHKDKYGYERIGEDHEYVKDNNYLLNIIRESFAKEMGCKAEDITNIEDIIQALPEKQGEAIRGVLSDNPYIEGAWMTKHDDKYYLQYACSGTEYNVYADGVYVSENPLGPFSHAKNNPYSYHPGGFIPGAGHGSTLEDLQGRFWHMATMRISMNHAMERRVGLWPAGFDEEGELFCNQRYGDWPRKMEEKNGNLWENPEWMLLSYGKNVIASSGEASMKNVVDENVQTWWKADTNDRGEWVCVDLGADADVRAIQVNFADDVEPVDLPEGRTAEENEQGTFRYIEERVYHTQWMLESSTDGKHWVVIEDKRNAQTDLAHDLVVRENGICIRHVRLTIEKVPYDCAPCISGIRIFGTMNCPKPEKAGNVKAVRLSETDMQVSWEGVSRGALISWGHAPDKLYHSYLVHDKNKQKIKALAADIDTYFVRVDLYNEGGIVEGDVIEVGSTHLS